MINNTNEKPRILSIKAHKSNKPGELFSIENIDIDIDIKRVFYITNFSDSQYFNNRGNHSHIDSSQFLVNAKGEASIKLVNIFDLKEYNYILNSPSQCLFLPANYHIFMNHYSEDSVMIVLSDKNYSDDKINHYYIPERLDGFRDASEFMCRPLKEIIDLYNDIYKNCSGLMKFKNLTDMEFKKKFSDKIPTEKELYEFYSDTDNYILELTEYHSTHARYNLTQQVAQRILKNELSEVLDFGCGIGEDSLQLLSNGINSTICDIPSKTFDFARWRLIKHGFNPSICEIAVDGRLSLPREKTFDAIICFEVLMHVKDPLKTLDLLISLLDEGGFLFLTHRFDGNYSLALESNKHFVHSIDDSIKERGMSLQEVTPVWEGKNLYVYKKD